MRVLRIVLLVLLVSIAFSQKETFVPANDVSFTVTAEHRSFRVGEQLIVNYEISNVSNGPVYVPREGSATCPPNPHVLAWFENSSGRHFIQGYAGSCFLTKESLVERMKTETVLLKPRQHWRGHVVLDTSLFGGLKPGAYRIEAVLYGWNDKDFSKEQHSELQKLPAPLLRGEVPASTSITLTR
jgi:hypothetical protein